MLKMLWTERKAGLPAVTMTSSRIRVKMMP